MAGPRGGAILRAMQFEAALQIGFNLALSDVTAEEFAAICIIREEQLKREAKEAKRSGV